MYNKFLCKQYIFVIWCKGAFSSLTIHVATRAKRSDNKKKSNKKEMYRVIQVRCNFRHLLKSTHTRAHTLFCFHIKIRLNYEDVGQGVCVSFVQIKNECKSVCFSLVMEMRTKKKPKHIVPYPTKISQCQLMYAIKLSLWSLTLVRFNLKSDKLFTFYFFLPQIWWNLFPFIVITNYINLPKKVRTS